MKQTNETPVLSVCVVALSALVMVLALCYFLVAHIDTQVFRLSLALVITACTICATLFENKVGLLLIVVALVLGMVVKCLEAPYVVAVAFAYFYMFFHVNDKCKDTMHDWVLGIFEEEKEEA